MVDEIIDNLEEALMSRTGERDFFVFYHHTGGVMPILRAVSREPDFNDQPETVILERLAASDPIDFLYLRLLGDAYTKSGRIEDGLRIDLALTTLFPRDSTVFYNLACSWSILERIDKAIEAFSRAIDLGWNNLDFALQDADLENLRRDPRFAELASRLKPPSDPDVEHPPE